MKQFIVCFVLLVSTLAQGQEGTRFPSTKLTSEESGYVAIFGSDILEITSSSYRCYRLWMRSKTFEDLGDPSNAASEAKDALEEARAGRATASGLIRKLEYYIPPARFEKLHQALHDFATDPMRPIHERAPTCRDVYNAANNLKFELSQQPDLWTPTATPPSPMDVIFIPMGLPLRYNLTKGTFSLGHSFATPIGTIAFSMPLTSTTGTTREQAKVIIFEYEGRARAFALDRTLNVRTPAGMTLNFESLGFDSATGHITIQVSSTGATVMPTSTGPSTPQKVLRALPVEEE